MLYISRSRFWNSNKDNIGICGQCQGYDNDMTVDITHSHAILGMSSSLRGRSSALSAIPILSLRACAAKTKHVFVHALAAGQGNEVHYRFQLTNGRGLSSMDILA